MNRSIPLTMGLLLLGVTALEAQASIDLFVDTKTKQLFAEPGPGRVRLGTFEKVEETRKEEKAIAESMDEKKKELQAMEARIDKKNEHIKEVEQKIDRVASTGAASGEKKWFDKISLKGYMQARYADINGGEEFDRTHLMMANDPGIGQNSNLYLRRMRLALTADLSDHLLLYLQEEFAGNVPGISSANNNPTQTGSFAQLRDAYADVFVDKGREYRFRVGQQKIPFGWENLQSSQNRYSMERHYATDAMALRDERDLGVFAMWTPDTVQQRFKYLQKSGLRGSGDYGMVAFGVFNGQGANRFEFNDDMHIDGRVTYPFELPGEQILEVGASGYSGKYVANVSTFAQTNAEGRLQQYILGRNFFVDGKDGWNGVGDCSNVQNGNYATGTNGCTYSGLVDGQGQQDLRGAIHAILYPKPIGFQTEWTWGHAPALQIDPTQSWKNSLGSGTGTATLTTQNAWGGYVLASYKLDNWHGNWVPYMRWDTYNGGSKFDTNSPYVTERATEFGIEYAPWPELEVTAAYSLLNTTDLRTYTYNPTEVGKATTGGSSYMTAHGDVFRLQLQANY